MKKFLSIEQFKEQACKEGFDQEDVVLRAAFSCEEVKSIDPEQRVIDFTISTSSKDRMNDVVRSNGWDFDSYMKNPVVLFGHNYRNPPIGRALEVTAGKNKVTSRAQFMSHDLNPFAYMIYRMYQEGYMRAVSVGFNPSEWKLIEDDEGRITGIDFQKQELLEYSAVPVPANPEALMRAKENGIEVGLLRDWAIQTLDEVRVLDPAGSGVYVPPEEVNQMRKMLSHEALISLVVPPVKRGEETTETKIGESDEREEVIELEEGAETKSEEIAATEGGETAEQETSDSESKAEEAEHTEDSNGDELKTAISFNRAHSGGTPKAPEGEAWNAGEVIDNLPADHHKWLRIFTWYDQKASDDDGDGLPDAKSAWKLPHHKATGSNAVVWRGVAAAMASLLGARGGVNIPDNDRKGVYNHLAKHYKEFDKEAPDFKFVEAQVLRSEDSGYEWDEEGGQVIPKSVSEEDRDKDTAATEERADAPDVHTEEAAEGGGEGKGPKGSDSDPLDNLGKLLTSLLDKEDGAIARLARAVEDQGARLERLEEAQQQLQERPSNTGAELALENLSAEDVAELVDAVVSQKVRDLTGRLSH